MVFITLHDLTEANIKVSEITMFHKIPSGIYIQTKTMAGPFTYDDVQERDKDFAHLMEATEKV